MGNVPDEQISVDQFGVQIEGVTAELMVQENHFYLTSDQNTNATNTIGTLCRFLYTFPNNIRKNDYDGITIGNAGYSFNAFLQNGLYYTCNQNSNIQEYDFYFPQNSNFDPVSIRPVQGEIVIDENGQTNILAAGNTFSPNSQDFIYEGSQDITYYYSNGANQEPSSIIGVNKALADGPNPCLSAYCEWPCNSDEEIVNLKEKYLLKKALYESSKQEYELAMQNGNNTLADQKAAEMESYLLQMRKNAGKVMMHIRFDNTGFDRNVLREWIGNLNSTSSDIRVASDYLSTGDYNGAMQVLNNIPNKFSLDVSEQEDLNDVKFMFKMIGQNKYGLDEANQSLLEPVAAKTSGLAPIIAKNILTEYGRYYPTEYYLPARLYPPKGKGKKRTDNLNGNDLSLQKVLSVFPNPARAFVSFSTDGEDNTIVDSKIIITNSVGRQILEINCSNTDFYYRWNTDDVASGVYFYQLVKGTAIQQSGKIIILKE